MRLAFGVALLALGLGACTSMETTVVSTSDIAATNGEAVEVIQVEALGLTAIFHIVDIVQSDLDVVVNKLLVVEAKASGATKVDLKSASTTPRHGLYALTGGLIGITSSSAVGVAIK
jgi:hypothetical protein